jgi:DNA helicase-2/ATP-dependent DNA helicase PcrA
MSISLTGDLNQGQASAVDETEGSVLLIAGPGTGKTLTLVRRTLSIISRGLAEASEIVLCTFTEKAALELKERIRRDAAKFGVEQDLSALKVGTIHALCNDLIDQNRHHTALGNNYDVLEEMTQALFLSEQFNDIVTDEAREAGDNGRSRYFDGRWGSKWNAIRGMKQHFNKLAEELVDVEAMRNDEDAFTSLIADAFVLYREKLTEKNKIDFAHLQLHALDLLRSEDAGHRIRSGIKYVMVDEYQDTNRIQEELVFELARETGNLCVVGDEDQALYRFRGATVRNILEFPQKRGGAKQIELSVNYRSDPEIVTTYLDFMDAHDWKAKPGTASTNFRFDKGLMAARSAGDGGFPTLRLSGADVDAVAKNAANLIKELHDSGKASDFSQIAILLPSVRLEKSGPYIDALAELGIKSYCPRAKAYFANDEVKTLVACIAYILDWEGDRRGNLWGDSINDLAAEIDASLEEIRERHPDLLKALDGLRREITSLGEGQSSDKRVADFPFLLFPFEPFTGAMNDPIGSRNLAKMTKLIAVFHQYYGYPVVTAKNLASLRNSFFGSFLRFLYDSGEDDVEDPHEMFPPGMVQIMTIHQSKGLEFPFVLVGGLDKRPNYGTKSLDALADKFSAQVSFEPESRIGEFDAMRLFFVAMSRPEHLLGFLDPEDSTRHKRFDSIMGIVPEYSPGDRSLIEGEAWEFERRLAPKKPYSFTTDIQTFETCSRQYQMYRHLEFEPSRAVMMVFGTLVHQTIEDIHRMQLDGRGSEVDEEYIRDRFDFNLRTLMLKEVRYIGKQQQEAALDHVLNYWRNNRKEIEQVVEAEVDVTVEEENFVLNGSIDLVRTADGELEILDFKSSKRPDEKSGSAYLDTYYQQLCIYAHVYSTRTGITPSRLVLYWTGESDKKKARMVFDYDPTHVEDAASHFREVVGKIQAQEFDVVTPPDNKVCGECDFRHFCTSDGTISGIN